MQTRRGNKRVAQHVESPPCKQKKTKPPKIDFSSTIQEDRVVGNMRKIYKKIPIDKQTSINISILENISLEGLQGIKLKRLLHLLDAIYPNYKVLSDEKCQNYIFSILVKSYLSQNNAVEAYYDVPKNNKPIEQVNKNVIIDRPIKMSQKSCFHNDYSTIYPVQEGSVMGSCSNYLTRQNITREVLDYFKENDSRETLYYLHDKYNLDNISFVACQTIRTQSLYPSNADPNIKMMLREYCTLEFIGKSRTLGCVFPNNKTFGRYRLMLEKKKFIVEYQEFASDPIEHLLKKFSFVKKDAGFVQQQFRENSHRNQLSKNSKTQEVDVKNNKKEENKSEYDDDKDEDDDDEELKIDAKNSKLLLSRLCCNPSMMKPYRSILNTVYDTIARSDEGLTQLDLRRILNLPKYHVRNHLKNLISLKLVCSGFVTPQNPFRKFKTAHKKRRRRIVATGKMSRWDDKDLKARRFLGKKRSSFTKAEDSLLICCRIASILVKPDIKLSWCVNKRIVRNVLHKHFIESHDKTSDACLRRIKYLRNSSDNSMSIDELTVELRDDPEVKALLDRRKLINFENNVKGRRKANRNFNRLFLSTLEIVKSKVPNLLGITSSNQNPGDSIRGLDTESPTPAIEYPSKPIEINNYNEMKMKYEIVDCSSVAPNRPLKYQTSSLLKLAGKISENYQIDMDENNEMPTFTLLTSIFSYFTINNEQSDELDLDLKLPSNIVDLDSGNNNFKGLCEKANATTRDIITKLMKQPSAPSQLALTALHKCGNLSDCLVVQPCNIRFQSEHKFILSKRSLGDYTMQDVESLLSWIIVYPGIEHNVLIKEFEEGLIDVILNLELISKRETKPPLAEARLFGVAPRDEPLDSNQTVTYEAQPDAYVKYCQLLNL